MAKTPTIKPGNKGKSVQRAKTHIKAWLRHYKYTALVNKVNEVGMTYDADTVAAVKYIQKKHGLTPDGIIGPKTWVILFGSPKSTLKVRQPAIQYDGRKAGHTHGTIMPKVVVLHSTESHDWKGFSDLKGVLGYLSRTKDKLNCHLVVDAEGYTGHGANLTALCYHCKSANADTIGIEQVGFAHFSLLKWRGRKQQLETVARWLAFISDKYDIPLTHSTKHGICMHKDIPAGGHTDPGKGYPFAEVLRRAQELKKTGW